MPRACSSRCAAARDSKRPARILPRCQSWMTALLKFSRAARRPPARNLVNHVNGFLRDGVEGGYRLRTGLESALRDDKI